VKRTICKLDWWASAPRFAFEDEAEDTDLTYPLGYEWTGRLHIDYEQEALERLASLF
jgi:hypothetical protein